MAPCKQQEFYVGIPFGKVSYGSGDYSLFKIKKKRQKKILSKWDFIQSLLVETFQNVDTVKGLHLEYLFLEQFHNEYDNFLVKNYNLEKVLLLENA